MKIRNLFEASKTAVLAFGRMNPPTIGHKKLADKVASIPGDPYIFVTQSQKPKTDPLPFADKLKFAQASFPNVKVGSSDVKTIIQALQKIEAMGYDSIVYVAGSDRIQDFTTLINKYNGKEYNFKDIQVVSAGERDPDAEGAEGLSASKMRAAAATGDFDSFQQGVANPKIAQQMYDAVRKGMGVMEMANKPKMPKKPEIKSRDPNWRDMEALRKSGAAGSHKDKKALDKRGYQKHKSKSFEKAPPGREKQVKKLKGKFDDPGAPYAIAWAQHNKHGKPKKKTNEGYKLQLERDTDMMVLNIIDTATGKRTEVRGKPGYETGNYDPNDKLHMLLDKIGKSADISQLMNGEPVGINPKHPQGASAKAATDKAYNESTDLDSLRKFVRSQREAPDQVLYQMMMAPDTYGHSASNFVRSWYEKTKEENGLNDVDSALEIMVDELGINENFADGKKKGKSRPGRVKRAGASCNGSVTALRKRAKNASGEKAKMYHWCANMKSGKKKK